jgi:D-3-phosphoglycerate dehydrogenase
VLAENLGMNVAYYDVVDRLSLSNARRCESMADLLGLADVVSLHVDGRYDNKSLFGAAEFEQMKPGSLFLNLSRGFVVDYAALRAHLVSGHLAGAAIDVFPVEPSGRGDEFVSEVRGLPNVILTPHIAGSTEEAQQDIARFVATKIRDLVGEGSTAMSVNMPRIALSPTPNTHRLTLVHRNIPGVMATINGIFAAHDANVEAQLLATQGELGYVVTDIGTADTTEMVTQLSALPETVRFRQLS